MIFSCQGVVRTQGRWRIIIIDWLIEGGSLELAAWICSILNIECASWPCQVLIAFHRHFACKFQAKMFACATSSGELAWCVQWWTLLAPAIALCWSSGHKSHCPCCGGGFVFCGGDWDAYLVKCPYAFQACGLWTNTLQLRTMGWGEVSSVGSCPDIMSSYVSGCLFERNSGIG